MNPKILPISLVVLLIFTGLNVNANNDDTASVCEESEKIVFSEATIDVKDEFITLDFDETTSYITKTGQPMLPVYSKTYMFPLGTKIKNVECIPGEIITQQIDEKIQPAPEPVPLNVLQEIKNLEKQDVFMDMSVYSSEELYPNTWYDYKIGVGIDKGESVIFVNINFYPVRYSPMGGFLEISESVTFEVQYEENELINTNEEGYDLVIIAPNKFKFALYPLMYHKNNIGVNTTIKTTEEIYDEYTGRDKPEQIKYFIKDAKESWDVEYVLLVGGLKSYINANDREDRNQGSEDWYVPVRYTNIDDWKDPVDMSGYISDQYYSDLYRWNETIEDYEFEDWDSNENGIFLEGNRTWNPGWFEEVDLYQDVYLGRLPCRNLYEVAIMVNKIIKYERASHWDEPWFKRMIGIGGKTFQLYQNQPDGEYLCDVSLDYMSSIVDDPVRVYASNEGTDDPIPNTKDIVSVFSEGAGFVLFQGHGNPFFWDTHVAVEDDAAWVGGIKSFSFWRFTNQKKLPIVVVGGCHNGMFNVTIMKTQMFSPESKYHWTYGIPTARCFSWRLLTIPYGGAIASTGCTGLGLGDIGDPLSLSGELEANFFYEIGQNNTETLGQVYTESIDKYMGENTLDESDVYVITIYALFGDPSLRIGGYE